MLSMKKIGSFLAGAVWVVSIVSAETGSVRDKAVSQSSASKMAAQSSEPDKTLKHKLIVYYFHGSARCLTCRKFEALTKDIMETRFAEEVNKGLAEYRVINVDESGNEHYINEYQLYTKSVVLSDTKDGKQIRWKNLDRIWEAVRDEKVYRQYIENEVRSYLKES